MRIEELISRAASEGERRVTYEVTSVPPEPIARAHASGGIGVTDFLSASRGHAVKREVTYRHICGAPAGDEAFAAWQRKHPSHPLPADLSALVRRVNGIHLWADVATGRSYVGLAPIQEWDLARTRMFGPMADRDLLDDRFVALSYHEDDAAFVVLDVVSGTYYLMDTAGADTSTPIANDAEELLDWLWRTRLEPK